MVDNRISLIVKSVIGALVWFGLAVIIGIIIIRVTQFSSLQNILFVEGLILIFVGAFSSISADSIALFLSGGERTYRNEISWEFSLSTFSLLIGGILSSVVTFLM